MSKLLTVHVREYEYEMESIITLIISAIAIVAIKEIITRIMQSQTKNISKKKLEDNHYKILSRNFVWKMILKVGWFHLAFFVSAIVGGALGTTRNLALSIIYILLIIFIIVFSIRQQKKYYESFGEVEAKLTVDNKSALQRIVNTDESKLSKKEKQFIGNYKKTEKKNNKNRKQNIVNTDETKLSKKEKQFIGKYKKTEKYFGIPVSIVTFLKIVISIAMWIGTF